MLGQEIGMIQTHTLAAVTSLLVLRAEVTSQNFCVGISCVIIFMHLSSERFDIMLRLCRIVCFRTLKWTRIAFLKARDSKSKRICDMAL